MCGNSLLEELIVGDESIKLFDERLLNLKEPTSNPPQDARQEELKKQLWEKQKELLDLHAKNKLSMSRKKELDSQILAINKELNPKAKKTKPEAYHPVFFVEQADEYFKRLRELHKQFFTEYDPIKKKERRKQIEDIELEFIKSSIKEKVDEFDSKINNLNMQDPGDRKKQAVLMKKKLEYSAIPEQIRNSKTRPYFLWKLNFFEVFQEKGGFDVVIANPPYIGFQGVDKVYKQILQRNFQSAVKKFDFYIPFIEKSFYILKEKGFAIFICPTAFAKRDYGDGIRSFLLQNSSLRELIDFEHSQVFDKATNYTGIFSFSRFQDSCNKLKHRKGFKAPISLIDQSALSSKTWIFTDEYAGQIINKIKKDAASLGQITKISEGVVTGFNDLYLLNEKYIEENNFEKDAFCPCLRGKEIDRYFLAKNSEVLFYPYEMRDNKTVLIDKSILEKKAPQYYKFLEKHKIKILDRKYFVQSSKKWYELWNQRTLSNFITEKIVTPELSDRNRFALAKSKIFYGDTVCGILIRDEFKNNIHLKYLLALLNSALIEWFYKQTTVPKAGGFFIYKVMFLKDIPIRIISPEQQKYFIDIVEKILSVAKRVDDARTVTNQAKIKEYERQIDLMVYKLYGLTPEEVKIVESFQEKEKK